MIPFQVKNIMTASTGRTTVNTTIAWEDMQMPLNDINDLIGSKLKLENNQITVQKDMKALVSLFFGCSASNFTNTELDYYIKINDLDNAKKCFSFVVNTSLRHGFLAEQVNNDDKNFKWVIGLGWSHAMFIIVLNELLKANEGKNN